MTAKVELSKHSCKIVVKLINYSVMQKSCKHDMHDKYAQRTTKQNTFIVKQQPFLTGIYLTLVLLLLFGCSVEY